ncbi:MAG: flagellar motor protein MotA [Cohaesibacteraceae bacterium]|nr:flagellar motor protein MotA [Cohaesibacteraceae bacterium]MBL4876908.1 flagellar motor protein MotA [Cohaesibacteraceae bacterium]
MVKGIDPYKLSSPQVYLWRMLVFLTVSSFVALVLYRQILSAFQSNPGLNIVILSVLIIGIFLSFRQVIRLFREISWVNGFRLGDPGLEVTRSPVLLAPMATLLGDRIGRMSITTQTMRSILESIALRLDEARELARYLTGLLVFLGLLGTFWGLLATISSVGDTIQSLSVGSGDAGVIFEDLKSGLAAPLQGMGTAFSSSLFGLAGSLVLGFLDLQAGQAQNRFYTNLEDWLSTVTAVDIEALDDEEPEDLDEISHSSAAETRALLGAINSLSRSIETNRAVAQTIPEGGTAVAGSNRAASTAMANLADGIQGLVQHIRSEQQLMQDWAEGQAEQQDDIKILLEQLIRVLSDENSKS